MAHDTSNLDGGMTMFEKQFEGVTKVGELIFLKFYLFPRQLPMLAKTTKLVIVGSSLEALLLKRSLFNILWNCR